MKSYLVEEDQLPKKTELLSMIQLVSKLFVVKIVSSFAKLIDM